MFFQPESPRWLLNANRVEEAKKVLQCLRKLPADHEYLNWEINTVLLRIAEEEALGAMRGIVYKLREILLPVNRVRVFSGVALMFIQKPVWHQRAQLLLTVHICFHWIHGHQRIATCNWNFRHGKGICDIRLYGLGRRQAWLSSFAPDRVSQWSQCSTSEATQSSLDLLKIPQPVARRRRVVMLLSL